MTLTILAILHAPNGSTGKVGSALEKRGITVECVCPVNGEALPTQLDKYLACIIFGGPQSANDINDPVIASELKWLEKALLPSSVPTLGICLGAQTIAKVMGGKVYRHEKGLVEIGYHKIEPTESGQDFMPQPEWMYQWHEETFEIPRSAIHLATSTLFPNQAFSVEDRIYGIEFHPEITSEIIDRWCQSEAGSKQIILTDSSGREKQLDEYKKYASMSDRWFSRFLDNFLTSHE